MTTAGMPSHGRDEEDKRAVTMTFRINEHTLNALRDESARKEISLNTLVNQILKRFAEWDMYESKVGIVRLTKPVAIYLFANLDEKQVTDLAKQIGKNAHHDLALFMKHEIDIDSFLAWYETRMRVSSVETNHRFSDGVHSYIMKHELGYNWSLFHKTILETIFMEMFQKSINVAATNTTLSFRVATNY